MLFNLQENHLLLPLTLTILSLILSSAVAFTPISIPSAVTPRSHSFHSITSSRSVTNLPNSPSELPDSLEDSAQIAAESCGSLVRESGMGSVRCRVDFDTSVGDATYTLLKGSTNFMQKFVTALCYEMIPSLGVEKRREITRLVEAKNELRLIREGSLISGLVDNNQTKGENEEEQRIEQQQQMRELSEIVRLGGRDPSTVNEPYSGPTVRIYFPDEGSAALARRDWISEVPRCVCFSGCGGYGGSTYSNLEDDTDSVLLFFCPRASEAKFVESTLLEKEGPSGDAIQLAVFVNPILVDMEVTGFGMAGRMLRERLIDKLTYVYHLRTLPWGALTRVWPSRFSVWREDTDAVGGYRLLKNMDQLPSNEEVEDTFDIDNGDGNEQSNSNGLGILDAIADFANGMMKL